MTRRRTPPRWVWVSVLVVVLAGLASVGVRQVRTRTLGACRPGVSGGEGPGAVSMLREAGEFLGISTWSVTQGAVNPPVDRTVHADARVGAWRGAAASAQPVTAHDLTSDDVESALGRGDRVVSTMGKAGDYDNYLLIAIAYSEDEVFFLGECADATSRWFADTASRLGMRPVAMLTDYLDHRGSSAFDVKVLQPNP